MAENYSKSEISAKSVTVTENDLGQRLDNFLFKILKGIPKSRIYRGVRKGEFRVNGGRVKATHRIALGDSIRIPPLSTNASTDAKNPQALKVGAKLIDRVVFEDNEILVIDKPSGLAVHGGSGLSFGLIEGLRQARENKEFLELVHRIDRETSGLLILAKTSKTLKYLHSLFRESKVKKKYLALVNGRWPRASKRVDAPIKKNIDLSGERRSVISSIGKSAITDFRVIRRHANTTLVEATPITGRTHQIRVHAQHVGNPIIGDEKYGFEDEFLDLEHKRCIRLFLHAHHISFAMSDGKYLEFNSDLDDSLNKLLDFYCSEPNI